MFAIAARRMGYRVHTFSPETDTPTGQVADVEIKAHYDDLISAYGTNASVGIRTSDWYTVGGGDGFQTRSDPEDANYVYATSQNGAITRLDLRTGQSRGIRPPSGRGGGPGMSLPGVLQEPEEDDDRSPGGTPGQLAW